MCVSQVTVIPPTLSPCRCRVRHLLIQNLVQCEPLAQDVHDYWNVIYTFVGHWG
jgi:hypothetical protein